MEQSTFAQKPLTPTPHEENSLWEIIKFAALALVIVIPIRMFVGQPFIVSGESMSPTFENANYLIVDELSYHFHEPVRGDVIVFRYPKDTSKFFIKRVIGLPGETVKIAGNTITVINTAHPEGFTLDEEYVKHPSDNTLTREVGTDELFVMGDNRSGSSDSRVWGNLPEKDIIGRVFVRLFPLKDISYLPGSLNSFK